MRIVAVFVVPFARPVVARPRRRTFSDGHKAFRGAHLIAASSTSTTISGTSAVGHTPPRHLAIDGKWVTSCFSADRACLIFIPDLASARCWPVHPIAVVPPRRWPGFASRTYCLSRGANAGLQAGDCIRTIDGKSNPRSAPRATWVRGFSRPPVTSGTLTLLRDPQVLKPDTWLTRYRVRPVVASSSWPGQGWRWCRFAASRPHAEPSQACAGQGARRPSLKAWCSTLRNTMAGGSTHARCAGELPPKNTLWLDALQRSVKVAEQRTTARPLVSGVPMRADQRRQPPRAPVSCRPRAKPTGAHRPQRNARQWNVQIVVVLGHGWAAKVTIARFPRAVVQLLDCTGLDPTSKVQMDAKALRRWCS